MELTKKDRLFLINQLLILEKLYPEEQSYYAEHRKALQEGYKLHYSWLFSNLDDEMSEEECREVLDILEMYRAITFSYKKLKDKQGVTEEEIKFKGFDGNEETKQFSYVLYFTIDLKRYDELKDNAEYPNFNSHFPMLPRYRKMLNTWKNFPKKHTLDIDQIKLLLKDKH